MSLAMASSLSTPQPIQSKVIENSTSPSNPSLFPSSPPEPSSSLLNFSFYPPSMLEDIENGCCNAQPQAPRYSLTEPEKNTESELEELKKKMEKYKEIILDNKKQIETLKDWVKNQQELIIILEKMVKVLETVVILLCADFSRLQATYEDICHGCG